MPKSEDAVRKLIELWNKHDAAGAANLLSDDVEYWDVTQAVVFKSKSEVKEFFRSFFEAFPNLKFELLNIFSQNDSVACEWKMQGTQAKEMPGMSAVGKSFEVAGVSICTIKQGKIRRQVDYWDSGTIMRHLGLAS